MRVSFCSNTPTETLRAAQINPGIAGMLGMRRNSFTFG
jgi:hypothetical protein